MFKKYTPVYSKNPTKKKEEQSLDKIQSLLESSIPYPPPNDVEKDNNEIYFFTDVTQETCHDLCRKINDMNKELLKYSIQFNCAPPSIYLYINSLGGDLLSAFGVVDTIKNSRIPIVSIIHGQAASAATIISMSCHKRYATKHSFMLIHQLSTGCEGKYEELYENFKNDTLFMDTLYDLYSEHTTMKKDEIKEALKHDLWWGIDKCIEKGLIDDVWTPHSTSIHIQNLFNDTTFKSDRLIEKTENGNKRRKISKK
jgi:ATP-dependent Clp protease protease subunit